MAQEERNTKQNSYGTPQQNSFFLFFLVVLVIAASLIIAFVRLGRGSGDPSGKPAVTTTGTTAVTTTSTTGAKNPLSPMKTEKVDTKLSAVGPLSIINEANKLTEARILDIQGMLTELYGNRNSSYDLSNAVLKLHKEAIDAVNALFAAYPAADLPLKPCPILMDCFRSFADQSSGSYSASAGASDFHSGYGFSLRLQVAAANATDIALAGQYNLDDQRMAAVKQWMDQNAATYGIIERYPANNTGTDFPQGQVGVFRYVGIPHAYAMTVEGSPMSLESYVTMLQTYTADSPYIVTALGTAYAIYYQPASAELFTTLTVPQNLPYTVSGDNCGGFIVTVTLGAAD